LAAIRRATLFYDPSRRHLHRVRRRGVRVRRLRIRREHRRAEGGQLLQWSKCVAQQVQNQTSAGSAAIAGQCGNPPGGVSGDLSSNFIRPDFLQCLENEAQNPNATPQSAAAACSSTP
jgi:hypothetical protein